MTVKQDETETRIRKLQQRASKVFKDIETFDVNINSPEELNEFFKEIGNIKSEVDDEMNMLEVEDFLLNGAGYNKNKNI